MTTELDSESLNIATQLTGVDAKWLQPFDVTDPFNDEIRLQGFVSQKSDHRYGALAITHVDGALVPQLVLATPKLHYPFGKDGSFHFPPIQKIYLYEKLDGTNVLAFRYRDEDGAVRLTYKLRLSPVVRNSRWGPFLDMWQEMLKKHPQLPDLVEKNNCHVSFELYGARNTHLMVYDVDLAGATLFGVRHDASIIPAAKLDMLGVPSAPLLGELTGKEDPVAKYAEIRAEMESKNRQTEEDKLTGIEGTVWYVEQPGGQVSMWKCKPESVEAIHWALGINKAAVLATCWNFLETGDDLRYETLLPLLLEEYTIEEIQRFRHYVDQCIELVRAAIEFRDRVLALYSQVGLSIHTHKAEVMRALSGHFRRDEMKKVYSVLMKNV
jgi:hypothetical protein